MKRYNYLHLPMLLLLASTFFSVLSVVNAADVYSLCAQGDKEACYKVKDIQRFYNLKKMLALWELDELFKFPPCDPRYCDPQEFIGGSLVDPVELREVLVNLVGSLDKEIETLDQFN